MYSSVYVRPVRNMGRLIYNFNLYISERLTVPAYLAGTNDIGITGNQNLVQVAGTSSFTSSSGNKQVTLFPGKMWVELKTKAFTVIKYFRLLLYKQLKDWKNYFSIHHLLTPSISLHEKTSYIMRKLYFRCRDSTIPLLSKSKISGI